MDANLSKTYKLTETHFKKFKKHFHYWIDFFGLKDWELAFSFDKAENADGDDARASVHYDGTSKIVIICLNKEFVGSEPTEYNLARCAYHEVLELLLGKLNFYMRNKCTEDEIEEEIHRVIRIFENVHFEDHWSRNK
jgi:hypothetical protein